uniref:Fatty acid amide hydrolase 2b n=1 Tax=Sinocyclocheilus anshuiensis TaxID=1608454 RepID=A0A671P5K4_9TELE
LLFKEKKCLDCWFSALFHFTESFHPPTSISYILTYCISVWFSSCTVNDKKALQRVVFRAQRIIGVELQEDIYRSCCAPTVALLKRAGAIPLGVTNTSDNHLYGITSNPYDLERMRGGSSGGEGSIIGGGASVIGIGSDIGGSILMPCFFNGIFGHKPSKDVVSNDGQFPTFSGLQNDYLGSGPMCRYAEDLLPLLKIMAGPTADKLSLSKELIQAQKKVAARLEADLGVTVKEVSFSQLKYSFQIWDTFLALPDKDSKPPQPFVELMADGGSVWPIWELIKRIFGRSGARSSYGKEELQREMENLLGTDGVLLYTGNNCLKGYKERLPLGVQVVTGKLQDHLPLAVALYLDKAFGG